MRKKKESAKYNQAIEDCGFETSLQVIGGLVLFGIVAYIFCQTVGTIWSVWNYEKERTELKSEVEILEAQMNQLNMEFTSYKYHQEIPPPTSIIKVKNGCYTWDGGQYCDNKKGKNK